MQANGKVLVAGSFTSVSNRGTTVARNGIARLDADGEADLAFDPSPDNVLPVTALAVQPDGKILLGGRFTVLAPNGGASVTRNRIARLTVDGTVDLAWNPGANGEVDAIAVQNDGKVVLGGAFTALTSNGGAEVTHNRLARINADGTLEDHFDPNPASNSVSDKINAIAVQSDGKILVGGAFQTFAPNGGAAVTRPYLARLNADGTVDPTFNPNPDSVVLALGVQADGKILVGGMFTSFAPNGGGTVSRPFLARLNADGTVDPTFSPNPGFTPNRSSGDVLAITLQPDGRILVGGRFISMGGVTCNHLARLEADGTLDTGFDPNPNSSVNAIAVQSDGKIWIGGQFAALAPNGLPSVDRGNIARLTPEGFLDPAFNQHADEPVYALALQTDGKVLVGGAFTHISSSYGATGLERNHLARFTADGTLDTAFFADVRGDVYTIVVQTDGRILIGGAFPYALNGFNHGIIVDSDGVVATRHFARLRVDAHDLAFFDEERDSNVDSRFERRLFCRASGGSVAAQPQLC